MKSAKSPGRLIGVLLFLQLAGLIVPFVLLHPLTTGPQDFLANAAGPLFRSGWLCFSCLRIVRLRSAFQSRHGRSFVSTASVWHCGSWLPA